MSIPTDFKLSKYTARKGCFCKVQQEDLLGFLKHVSDEDIGQTDCSIQPTKFEDVFQVTSIDFFTPVVDNVYLQGRIAIANVLSDIYSLGITDLTTVVMVLCLCPDWDKDLLDVVAGTLMRGFSDGAKLGGVPVDGGQTTYSPWPMIGGTVMSVSHKSEIINGTHASVGDVVILTKPLGTQPLANAMQWLWQQEESEHRRELVASLGMTREEIETNVARSGKWMAMLNKTAAEMMHHADAVAATDITGFGLLNHATNLMKTMQPGTLMKIDRVPCMPGAIEVTQRSGFFKLLQGKAAETSGGLLVILPASKVESALDYFQEKEGYCPWVVGQIVEEGQYPWLEEGRRAGLATDVEFFSADAEPKVDLE
ncbi:hypothetical protein PCE1_001754 [Barthelona sp. PCE]